MINDYNDFNVCPDWLFKLLDARFNFYYDLACESWNKKCPMGLPHDNGFDSLKTSWADLSITRYNYCFPPISRPHFQRFLQKAYNEAERGAKTVVLAPLKTLSTVYYNKYRANEIIILNPKVNFYQGGVENSHGDATVILIYNKDIKEEKISYVSIKGEHCG